MHTRKNIYGSLIAWVISLIVSMVVLIIWGFLAVEDFWRSPAPVLWRYSLCAWLLWVIFPGITMKIFLLSDRNNP